MPWADISYQKGRNELPWLLDAHALDLRHDLDDYAVAVEEAWTGAEWPMSHLRKQDWSSHFASVGFLDNQQRSTAPDTPIIIYRGALRTRRFGWSWTDDVGQAQWFADRLQHAGLDGRVWTTTIPAGAALAHFHGAESRGESEWVFNPTGVKVRPHEEGA